MDQLLTALADWKSFNAIVVGDFMLDQLLSGEATRLSPDAPVPVLKVTKQENNPGGSANLSLDLVALSGEVIALGIIGDDPEGQILVKELNNQSISTVGMITDQSRPTTVKRNLIGLAQGRHAQKMFRVDFESDEPISSEIENRILESFDQALLNSQVVCIEDYNKGVCTERLCQEIIKRSKLANVPVFVDPAPIKDYSKYAGATAITPNRTEAELATGIKAGEDSRESHREHLARTLLDANQFETVVLTLDKQGAVFVKANDTETVHVPTVAREVYDVTGAGDMMLAALAAARANDLGWIDSVRFANAAAGLEVEIFGVAPIPVEQVHSDLLRSQTSSKGQARTLDEVIVQSRAARKANKKIVFTNGCFDVLHAGHVSLLQRCAELGDMLILGVNDDHSVHALKGDGRPVNNQNHRAHVLQALGCVDSVVLFSEETPIKLIEAIKPDVLVKGGDYTIETVVGHELVAEYGGQVVILDLIDGLSTTNTIEKMKNS
ncbi:MAG: D-glycero-beta-D-manno-heptose 1-phosphate adenylyltransferase [Phycisphaerales bacterium]|nr:D-glycero-beta-D-manno-heptose 1-phosphate adenylyltransferase [Phycisphaerales bacterium]